MLWVIFPQSTVSASHFVLDTEAIKFGDGYWKTGADPGFLVGGRGFGCVERKGVRFADNKFYLIFLKCPMKKK